MEHHGTVGRKECYYIFSYILFWHFCVFVILITFIDEVSNLHNNINQSETRIGDKRLLVELNVQLLDFACVVQILFT